MKKIWKRYLLLLSVLACILCLTACGDDEDKDTVSYNADTEEYIESEIRTAVAQGYMQEKVEVSEYVDDMMSQIITYIEQGFMNADRKQLEDLVSQDEEMYASQASYLEATEDLGDYKSDSAYNMTFEADEEGMTATGMISFEKRDVMFVLNQGENQTITVTFEKDLTLGEILEKAGINTLLGMGTVFLVLILISIVIWALGVFAMAMESKVKQPEQPVAAVPVPVPETVDVQAEEEDVTDDLELVAVISAAIAASEGTSADGFVVRSIKRVNHANRRRA